MNGAIVAGVISIILIYFGGRPGQIGGIVGILGAILAAAKPYLPWSRGESARIVRVEPPGSTSAVTNIFASPLCFPDLPIRYLPPPSQSVSNPPTSHGR